VICSSVKRKVLLSKSSDTDFTSDIQYKTEPGENTPLTKLLLTVLNDSHHFNLIAQLKDNNVSAKNVMFMVDRMKVSLRWFK
jgi:hypothetical protein